MNGKKILIIEDDPLNMELESDLLTAAGYEVVQAVSGEEGIAAALRELPDLVLADVGLPRMSGLEATRIIKSDPRTKDIPVLIVSSYAMREDRDKAMAAGASGYLSKPIDTKNLLGKTAEILALPKRMPS